MSQEGFSKSRGWHGRALPECYNGNFSWSQKPGKSSRDQFLKKIPTSETAVETVDKNSFIVL